MHELRAAIAQADQPVVVPQGWKLVPLEPTHAMAKAAGDLADSKWCICLTNSNMRELYHAMLAASPSPAPAVQEGIPYRATLIFDKETRVVEGVFPVPASGYDKFDGTISTAYQMPAVPDAAKPETVQFNGIDWDGKNPPTYAEFVAAKPGTQERAELIARLHAMAENYKDGHAWDKLDGKTVLQAAALLSAGPVHVEPLTTEQVDNLRESHGWLISGVLHDAYRCGIEDAEAYHGIGKDTP